MGAAYEILNQAPNGVAKVRYTGIDQVGYRDLDQGLPESKADRSLQQSYAASIGNTSPDYTMVRDSETGEIVTRQPSDEVIEVSGHQAPGERGTPQSNHRFSLRVDDVDQARQLLEENRDEWEAFQLYGLWEFVCKNRDGGEPVVVGGWSEVTDEISHVTHRRPVVDHQLGDDGEPVQSELAGWETVETDTVEAAYQKASDHAWSKVDCSVAMWRNVRLEVVMYAPLQSDWADQAAQYSHIRVGGQ